MTTLALLFAVNPQMALMTPQGLRYGYVPFFASHWWLADHARFRGKVITVQEYIARVMASEGEALNMRCAERGVQPAATREETIARLLEGLADLQAPHPYEVATWQELVIECRLRGLPADGDLEALRARLLDGEQRVASQPPPAADDAPSDLVEETSATAPPVIEPAQIQAPAPVAAAASKAVASPEQIGQLKALLNADDYNGVWSLATNLTETRPADKSKARVMSWARELLASLEG